MKVMRKEPQEKLELSSSKADVSVRLEVHYDLHRAKDKRYTAKILAEIDTIVSAAREKIREVSA